MVRFELISVAPNYSGSDHSMEVFDYNLRKESKWMREKLGLSWVDKRQNGR